MCSEFIQELEMKKTLAMALLMVSSIGQADTIKCMFTEPVVISEYSTTELTLTYKGVDQKAQVLTNVSIRSKTADVLELVSANGRVLQTLTLNYKGSDGMSDTVYPLEVQDT